MKPCLLLTRLCDICQYSWNAARANHFPNILFIKKQPHWSNDKTIIKHSYRKVSWFVSVSQINYLPQLRLLQIIDLLATDKSWYFAQPRPIIANYYSFKILPQFWMAKSTCIILHNQLLMTKFGRIFCLTRKWPQKCSLLQVNEPLTEKTWGQGWVVLVVKTKWLTLHSFQE